MAAACSYITNLSRKINACLGISSYYFHPNGMSESPVHSENAAWWVLRKGTTNCYDTHYFIHSYTQTWHKKKYYGKKWNYSVLIFNVWTPRAWTVSGVSTFSIRNISPRRRCKVITHYIIYLQLFSHIARTLIAREIDAQRWRKKSLEEKKKGRI